MSMSMCTWSRWARSCSSPTVPPASVTASSSTSRSMLSMAGRWICRSGCTGVMKRSRWSSSHSMSKSLTWALGSLSSSDAELRIEQTATRLPRSLVRSRAGMKSRSPETRTW